jgi:hypothetical protein
MNLEIPALIALVLAAIPCGLFLANLSVYRPPAGPGAKGGRSVSVLIPARNEEKNIRATLEAALANHGIDFEIIVLDDHSTDGTAGIVAGLSAADPRVRLETAPPLPAGWCGKPHACQVLARRARHPLLVFIDADVRLAPEALVRLAGFIEQSGAALASGVPRQELGTFSERLLIPLIHFILLGFLPMRRMRRTRSPAFSAGCGQLFVAVREAYQICGGHARLRDSLHDGIKLPRVFRRAGFRTDLFDATELATCRMYRTNGETCRGLGKNATEALAAPAIILPMTFLLLFGQVVPFGLLALAPGGSWAFDLAVIAAGLALLPRLVAARRFRQSWLGSLLHPVGVLFLLGIQWRALWQKILGRPMRWKGREYLPAKAAARAAARVALVITGAALLFASPARAGSTPPSAASTNLVCPGFELQDQFGTNHCVQFPQPHLTLLIVADRKGSEQIDAWVAALAPVRCGRFELLGVADVGGAPGWVHGLIRQKFREKYSCPILLDWSGDLPASLHCRKAVANVFLLDPDGRVLATERGKCDTVALPRLNRAIDLAVQPG